MSKGTVSIKHGEEVWCLQVMIYFSVHFLKYSPGSNPWFLEPRAQQNPDLIYQTLKIKTRAYKRRPMQG